MCLESEVLIVKYWVLSKDGTNLKREGERRRWFIDRFKGEI